MFFQKKAKLASKQVLKNIYDCDLNQKIFFVKIAIKNYHDIFNDLDPAPLKRRDLDQAMVSYLDECSDDIPLKYKIDLHIVADRKILNKEKEERVKVGLKTYFGFLSLSLKQELLDSYKKSFQWIIFSIILIFSFFIFSNLFQNNIFLKIISEGLLIGGWVFLWEAIALLAFENKETKIRYKKYLRLQKANIEFFYN